MVDFVERRPTVDVLISETTTGGSGEVLRRHMVVVTFLRLDSERCKDIVKISFKREEMRVICYRGRMKEEKTRALCPI